MKNYKFLIHNSFFTIKPEMLRVAQHDIGVARNDIIVAQDDDPLFNVNVSGRKDLRPQPLQSFLLWHHIQKCGGPDFFEQQVATHLKLQIS